MHQEAASELGAILLAGGRASRVGGAPKPLFEVGGRTLLAAAVDAVRDGGARPITVAAPLLDPALDVGWVQENPPFGGPVAGAVAVLDEWDRAGWMPAWTFLLACDLPRVADAVAQLARDLPLLPRDADGICLGDPSSRPQWLTGVYRVAALRRAAAALPDLGRDAPVRALVSDLAIAVVAASGDLTDDIDTWEDLEHARTRAANP
ncbi:molybdenum cofactor guanylyltransferase [Microbacterium deminutum]|uniref:MobA-like NTP transferase domain-containing protein n=1 Tax=Microbacterium deminutum TaxID=344164 RepID=A0ABN2R490_9MICO